MEEGVALPAIGSADEGHAVVQHPGDGDVLPRVLDTALSALLVGLGPVAEHDDRSLLRAPRRRREGGGRTDEVVGCVHDVPVKVRLAQDPAQVVSGHL
jgi:hypothetical protein